MQMRFQSVGIGDLLNLRVSIAMGQHNDGPSAPSTSDFRPVKSSGLSGCSDHLDQAIGARRA